MNELSEEEQVIFLRANQNDSQASTTGTDFSGKCVTCQFFQPNRYPESDRPHHCALVNAPFAIAIFVSTVPNTLQPILKPLKKLEPLSFVVFSFSECFQLMHFSETLIGSCLFHCSILTYLPCMNYNFIGLDFRLRGCLESIISYASRLTINRTMAA